MKVLVQNLNMAIDQGKGYPWEVSGSVCKDDCNSSCHLNLIYMLLCQSSCGAVESILIPAESGLALWLTLTNGGQQGWRVWLLSLGLMRFYSACFHTSGALPKDCCRKSLVCPPGGEGHCAERGAQPLTAYPSCLTCEQAPRTFHPAVSGGEPCSGLCGWIHARLALASTFSGPPFLLCKRKVTALSDLQGGWK